MNVLFTGASSFTGLWFVRALARAGHRVTATYQQPEAAYTGVRAARVAGCRDLCRPLFACRFGDEQFLAALRDGGPWDVLCHHAADVTDYKSPAFDFAAALRNNTHNLAAVLEALRTAGGRRVVLTGSVFEPHEGAGADGLPAFSPYGLSKGLTAEAFRYYCGAAGLRLGKFVIANPVGPFEEPRFTAYLIKTWRAGQVAAVNTPAYVRDNIHVSLLARAYVRFAERLGRDAGFERLGPSQYVETQGAFAQRFAAEMGPRLGLRAALDLKAQTEFPEPRVRINTDLLDGAAYDWNEAAAWDEYAAYYREMN
jgi:UDP-glucose 4-epimerase